MEQNHSAEGSRLISVLFICLGNICRSPAAEGIMQSLVDARGLSEYFLIDSAGMGGWHVGQLPDARMRRHGVRRGYDFSSRARQFERADLRRFDYVITMDDENYQDVAYYATSEQLSRVHRMTEYLRRHKGYTSVPDPYYGGDRGFELVLDLLEDACEGLLEHIMKEKHISI